MRNLVIVRGPDASGRHAYIQKQRLMPWLVDQRMIESAFSEPVTDPCGGSKADPLQRQRLKNRILAILEDKMARGAFVVFKPSDTGAPYSRATASACDKMIEAVVTLASTFRYKVDIVDFSRCSKAASLVARRLSLGIPSDPKDVERALVHMQRRIGVPYGRNVTWREPDVGVSLLDVLEPAVVDLSAWSNIVAIGDIHGCSRTLARLTDNFEVRQDVFYLFLGDYINKGPDSGGVLRALLDRFMSEKNSLFLTGNHERPLCDWSRGGEIQKKTFLSTGRPSLEACGLTRADAARFLEGTRDAARLHWRGLDIFATHGGFACPPERLLTISAEHFQFGTGASGFDADTAWGENVMNGNLPGPKSVIQLHGHRNPNGRAINAGLGSYCLEDSVDRGGPLRALALSSTHDGYKARGIQVPNEDIASTQACNSIPEPCSAA